MDNESEEDAASQRLTTEELSALSQLSTGLIRLAVDCGCPTHEGKISHLNFAEWLVDHYEIVRAKAGLPVLPEVQEIDKQKSAYLRVGNSLRTITDYHASRRSTPEDKIAWGELGQSITRLQASKT